MEPPLDVCSAAEMMDLEAVKRAVELKPDSVFNTIYDAKITALHVSVIGGAFRTKHIIKYLLENTKASTLQKNAYGQDALDLAYSNGDTEAIKILYPYWYKEFWSEQLDRKKADLKVVKLPVPEP